MTPRSRTDRSEESPLLHAPAYTASEVAHYLDLPPSTVRAWTFGGARYDTKTGSRRFRPVIRAADPAKKLLSFRNLVEIHVLSSLRRQHGVSLSAIRRAVRFLARNLDSPAPLADRQMLTDGQDMFIEHLGQLISASESGQGAIRQVMDAYLKRIKRTRSGVAIRLYPVTRTDVADSPRLVAIDPSVQFGRPYLERAGVPTEAIASRYKSGEAVASLATDYGIEQEEVEEAIRYELGQAA